MNAQQAIRQYCIYFCCNGEFEEHRLCPNKDCPIWGYRFTAKIKDYNYKLTRIKAIKERCKDCHTEGLVKDCEFTDCQLYSFRLGKNPNRKGMGNVKGNPNMANISKKH